jgi:hypothetical protein
MCSLLLRCTKLWWKNQTRATVVWKGCLSVNQVCALLIELVDDETRAAHPLSEVCNLAVVYFFELTSLKNVKVRA